MKMISILGSTGSIGINSLNVISRLPEELSLFGISCYKNTALLHKQIKQFNPKYAVITDSKSYSDFTKDVVRDFFHQEIDYFDLKFTTQ